jgi:hypothetical protein
MPTPTTMPLTDAMLQILYEMHMNELEQLVLVRRMDDATRASFSVAVSVPRDDLFALANEHAYRVATVATLQTDFVMFLRYHWNPMFNWEALVAKKTAILAEMCACDDIRERYVREYNDEQGALALVHLQEA